MKTIFSFLGRINPYLSPLLVIICLVIIFYQRQDKQALEQSIQTNSRTVSAAAKVLDRYVDQSKANHIVIKDNILTKEQVAKLQQDNKYIQDTLAKALNIAVNKITEFTRVYATLEANNLKGKIDTNTKVASYSDKYANINYNPIDTTFGFKYNLELVEAEYPKRGGFLNLSKFKVTDLSSPDSRIRINSVDKYTVMNQDLSYGLRVESKALFNVSTNSLLIGPTIDLGLGKVALEGNYLYDTKINKFVPIIGAKLTLLKIN